MTENATFHAFRESGKWYSTARGYVPDGFISFNYTDKLSAIIALNNGCYPGLMSDGSSFVRVIIPDEDNSVIPFYVKPGE